MSDILALIVSFGMAVFFRRAPQRNVVLRLACLLPDAAAVKVTCLGTSSTVKGSLTHEFRRQHPLHNGPPAASRTARERLSGNGGNGLERLHFLHQEIRSILVAVVGSR